MPLSKEGALLECKLKMNCILVEWELINLNQAYEKLIEISSNIPRTITLEQTNNYWHGLCRSRVFRFPDDLEILKIPQKGLIQVRSCSRYGVSDLGVNSRRVEYLYRTLMKNS